MAQPTNYSRCTALIKLPNPVCGQCNEATGVYKCRGCMKNFCELHALPHREPMKVDLRDIRRELEGVKLILADPDLEIKCKQVMEEIHQWEQQSIREIHRVAQEAQSDVAKVQQRGGVINQSELGECRDIFRNRLAEAEKSNDYHERHLEYWRQFLVDLQRNFQRIQTVQIRLERLQKCLVREIKVESATTRPAFEFTKWCFFERNCGPCIDIRRSGTYETRSCCEPIEISPCRDVFIEGGVRNTEWRESRHISQGQTYAQSGGDEYHRISHLDRDDHASETTRSAHRSPYEDSGRE